ncbi:ROK family transcriptional regulator [Tunturibacter empetritectus]|uniref:NBD/HSP70 family sugar kinase n=1 Tax=Tunturiibacter empetritectus TaxID=3069691 RepID=A0A7W8IIR8_9BACT|nr:ROK family transcriptional regulator [Edaphobacter lichenicola]MBB5317897.1 putative NBD/HSP70 family sugar kinase [Edaphobacter lichenicola]
MPTTQSTRFTFTRRQSASNKTPRQINRNLVFNLVRTRQPLSRADLARVSGLQRSTVSLIVEDLIKERWILEGSTGRPPRGRRPTFLELNHQRVVIALDIHPSQTTVAVTDLGGKIVAQNVVELPEDPKKAIQPIIAAIRKLMAAHSDKSFDGIGISLPGRADPLRDEPIFAPNLKWPISSIKSRIQKATGLRVEMDNVANACALSEVWFGDSDGLHDLVVVNVSEGIGTGIFANGQVLRGANGMAGEFGHVQMEMNGPRCGCGGRGCWETVSSNRAGLRYYEEMSGASAPPTFAALVKMAQSHDVHAVKALEKMSLFLGRGLRMIANALAPSEIVVVGDITAAWYLFGPIVEAELKQNALSKAPRLRPAFEGNTARLRSAVALVMNGSLV